VAENKDTIVSSIRAMIPGYGAYRAQESRREDDRLTRSFLIKRIDECKSQLDVLGLQAAKSGDLAIPLSLEKFRNELDRARSRLAGAFEGYVSWFSQRVVDEKVLEQVAQQDSNLVSVLDLIGGLLGQSPLATDKLKENIELLHQRIDRRNALLK
jgi:hypothetical protein